MLKLLKCKKAQAIAGEYVLLIFLVVGIMTAMSIYFRRTIQARIYDSRDTMLNIVLNRTAGINRVGNIYTEYEPYYTNTYSTIDRKNTTMEELFKGGASKVTYNEEVLIQTNSVTAPPKDAK